MRLTESLCPECLEPIKAEIYEEHGKVLIRKTCRAHGTFVDTYWGDAGQYQRFSRYLHEGTGLSNPMVHVNGNCPKSCGLCSNHKTPTILANIDVTNRCNQRCPVCFANAASAGYLYEPSLEQIRSMMSLLRSERPIPCPALQFAGGEPTMRNDIVELVRMAREFDFTQIQMATNGIRLGQDPELCRELDRNGLHTVYMQFDGITPAPHVKLRGHNALPYKMAAIENCRRVGLTSVDLVPTLVKGVNDMEVGGMIRFAIENMDTVKGVNFQPVSFTGRIDRAERARQRITIPDLFRLISEQMDGVLTGNDFYPVPFVVPVSHFTNARTGYLNTEFTVHPHCGTGTYLYADNGNIVPITRFIDVEGLMEYIDGLAGDIERAGLTKPLVKILSMKKLISAFSKFVDKSTAPQDVNVRDLFIEVMDQGTGDAIKDFHRKTMFVGAMHFQDLYNFDFERIKRCGVHYATPDGRVIPFCTYNTLHRAEVERKFARPLE